MVQNLRELFSLSENISSTGDYNILSLNNDDSTIVRKYITEDLDFLMLYFHGGITASCLDGNALSIYKLSSGAFDTILHVWLSEQPLEKELLTFIKKILSYAQNVNGSEQKSLAVESAINDRGDINVLTVLNTAGKVYHEVHRIMGLLRFSPEENGEYIAKCEPDHFILPALSVYFTARFCDTPWSIIDEKRGLKLRRLPGEMAKINSINKTESSSADKSDKWKELWCHYHKTINNEDRNNPNLQRQLMPQRYWKYLPEV